LFSKDTDLIASGELTESSDPAAFKGLTFAPGDRREAEALLTAEPGTKFNFNTEEIRAFRDTKTAVAASQTYQRLLLHRYQSYRTGGLSGIALYDRGGGRFTKPDDELARALKASKLLAERFADVYRAVLGFPKSQPRDASSRFFWVNQRVENRPTFMLSHRWVWERPEAAVMVERQYYVGHSYNSLQLVGVCVRVNGGTLVIYSNHTSTDQVAGFGTGLRHSIGRDRMRQRTLKKFEEIRASVSK
jgi:hypothetical protein